MAISSSLSYDLDKVVNATKSDANIYRSIVDPLLYGDIAVPTQFFFTPPGYLLIVTSGFTACNVLFTVYLAYRLRITHAALAGLLQHAPAIHARTVPPYLIATYVPTVPQPPIFTLPSAQYMDYLGYIILGLFVLIILRKLCKCRVQRFASSPDFDIMS